MVASNNFTKCGNCGRKLSEKEDALVRKPCSKCGSISRRYGNVMSDIVTDALSDDLSVTMATSKVSESQKILRSKVRSINVLGSSDEIPQPKGKFRNLFQEMQDKK